MRRGPRRSPMRHGSAALGDYLHSKASGLLQQNIAPRIRPATKEETSVYQDFASEFADMTACFLFARVS
jgi:hypothetical protein